MNKLNFLLFSIFLLNNLSAFCQQKANVHITFPQNIIGENIEVAFFGNRTSYETTPKKIPVKANENKIKINESFYTPFATIQFILKTKTDTTAHSFYIGNKPAVIVFTSPNLKTYTLKNAYSLDTLSTDYGNQVSEGWKIFEKFQDTLRSNPDSVNWQRNADIINEISSKTRDFIRSHIKNQYDAYYTFELFAFNEAANQFTNPDTSLIFFETTFSNTLKNSLLGKSSKNKIYGLIIANAKGTDKIKTPDFYTKDIFGKKINLKDELGKGVVLINFWATWCSPCVAELPAIEKIHRQYPTLKIISVSGDKDSSKFIQALQEYKMNWTNVYSDFALADKFGVSKGWPELYLINKNGEIIYNRNKDETDLVNLKQLNIVLEKK